MFLPIGDDNSGRRRTPFIVWGLLLANAAVWYQQLTQGAAFTAAFSMVPYELTHSVDLVRPQWASIAGERLAIPQAPGPQPIYATLVSAMFMHGSWMHIISNMLYLWIFGDQIEDYLGHFRFLLFYLACGLAASAAHIAMDPESIVPCLGASGAIAGVLGAYLIKFPGNRVRVLLFRDIVWIPAVFVLGMWILLQVLSQAQVSAGAATGVAYMAHIGGFAAGVLLVLLSKRAS
jgi:membrane associated rhomboid family serine protease